LERTCSDFSLFLYAHVGCGAPRRVIWVGNRRSAERQVDNFAVADADSGLGAGNAHPTEQ